MNAGAIESLRRKLAAGTPVVGLWITLDAPAVADMAVALGLDWIVIDAEHGHLDWGDINALLRATIRSQTVCLVRIAELNAGLIKRVLDIGADGVVVPWIETPDQLAQAVSMASYPPRGKRGVGAERATAWGKAFAQHAAEANDQVLIVPILESVTAEQNIHQLANVPGVDLYFFGPADFSASAGYPGQWEGPGVAERILGCKDVLRAAGKQCGIITTGPQDLKRRREQGFGLLGLGLDTGLLLRGIEEMQVAAGQYRQLTPSLEPTAAATIDRPLARPPESFRPDRREVMSTLDLAPTAPLDRGVTLRCLVGNHIGARNLTTGIVTFEPAARLAYHTHPCGETITLLAGRAAVLVEGRQYVLERLDNITIPKGLAHACVNLDNNRPAELHVALASSEPARELVDDTFPHTDMASDSRGTPGKEHVVRFARAKQYSPGPQTSFVDYLNAEMIPGIEMSGGYGEFTRGGRLPAHVHDFDESICIIEGNAQCIVEGQGYSLSDCATAQVPRGRVHYFINEQPQPMAMIWVYAGPMPERLVVDERCATQDGNPWRSGD